VTVVDRLPLTLWVTFWRLAQRYHRYTVEGLEHLEVPEARLIVGYHGRPIAYDMCMLTVRLYDRLGYLPHGMLHRGVAYVPPMRWLADGLGFVITDGDALAGAIARREHVVTTPGGGEEAFRRFDDRYRVHWDGHVGYVRLAIKYGLKIVPVGAAGADDTFIGLNSGPALGRRLGLPKDYAWIVWLGIGPLGLYPFSPPFPVRMHQMVGPPIDPKDDGATDPDDRDGVRRVHDRVIAAVQDLLDRARLRRNEVTS
jgi:1-acyl-sn-glycerol-3-phosphate acyltransferase